MGYHECPIEPDDIRYSPNDPDGIDCDTCEGSGEVKDDSGNTVKCSDCNGMGYFPNEPYYDEPQISDFI